MAKTNLDSVIRALVGVDRNHLGVVADIANRLNSADASRWHDRLSGVLQEGLPQIEPPPPLLVFDDQHVAVVDLSGPHDPKSFWQATPNAPARYVWTDVFAKVKTVEATGVVKVPYTDLPRATNVREILAAPGLGNFDASLLSKIIAKMITKQPNGESGDLLNDGKTNLFRCGSLLVGVRWDGIDRHWDVDGWSPDGVARAAGRVFSGNLIR